MGRLVYDICGTKDRAAFRKGAFAYGLSFLAMNVIFNSAAWGQSDAVYVSLIIWSLVWLFRDKYLKSFVLLGLAFAFKLQTVFILPFFAFYYVYKKSSSLGTAQYRVYNPNSPNGEHNWTTDTAEYNDLISFGWVDEGVCWKVI